MLAPNKIHPATLFSNRSTVMTPVDLTSVLKDNVTPLHCYSFVPDKEDVCTCGKDYAWHQRFINAWGHIRCRQRCIESSRPLPFICVDDITDDRYMKRVYELITVQWEVPQPSIILSIVGGTETFYIAPSVAHKFKRGLAKVATSTDVWIITDGADVGVTSYIGDVMKELKLSRDRDRSVVVLGISDVTCLENSDMLITAKGEDVFYDITKKKTSLKGQRRLEPNHSHFVLFGLPGDNHAGAVGDARGAQINATPASRMTCTQGAQISATPASGMTCTPIVEMGVTPSATKYDFRTQFEQHVCHSQDIPLISLVIEGDQSAVDKVGGTITSSVNHVILAHGSGRAADFLTSAYQLSSVNLDGSVYLAEDFHEKLASQAISETSLHDVIPDAPSTIDYIGNLLKQPQYRQRITVLNMNKDDTTELPRVILQSLLTNNKSSIRQNLELALAWDLYDIARTQIISKDTKLGLPHDETKILYYDLFYQALVKDKPRFVQLLLERGVKLSFIWGRVIVFLWTKHRDSERRGSTMRHLFDETECRRELPEEFIIEINKLKSKLGLCKKEHDDVCDCYEEVEMPATKLFLWAVLYNQQELARLFWIMSKDHIGGALSASCLLQTLSRHARMQGELNLDAHIQHHARLFRARAVGVLEQCYSKNKKLTHRLLTRTLDTYHIQNMCCMKQACQAVCTCHTCMGSESAGTTRKYEGSEGTLFSMAYTNEHMEFLAHSACQTRLNEIWRGRMHTDTPTWRVTLCACLPFCIPLNLIRFKPNRKDKNKVDQTQGTFGRSKKQLKNSRLFLFYTAPIVKFGFKTLSDVVYLVLFSYFVMVKLKCTSEANWYSPLEFYLWFWAFTLFCEEIRQMRNSVSLYVKSSWNLLDQLSNLCLFIAIILRMTVIHEYFIYARICYSMTVLCYYIRLLQIFLVSKTVGPQIIMVRKMLTDIWFFLCILLVFLIAYGVLVQSLGNPNSSADWLLLHNVVLVPYWQMYGDTTLEDLFEFEHKTLLNIIFAVYLMITHVLLLNLLIAMLSYTFTKVHDNALRVWCYYRYSLVYEFADRPALPPPFIVFSHVIRTVKWLHRKICASEPRHKTHPNVFEVREMHEINTRLTAFERVSAHDYDEQQTTHNVPHINSWLEVQRSDATGGLRTEPSKPRDSSTEWQQQPDYDSPYTDSD